MMDMHAVSGLCLIIKVYHGLTYCGKNKPIIVMGYILPLKVITVIITFKKTDFKRAKK
jgi:hypothetical protein